MEEFVTTLHEDLYRYLVQRGAVDDRMPECPDVEAKWAAIAEAYLPDGAREFADYPIASLGWMMFIGMAVAKYWDSDWERYADVEDLYIADEFFVFGKEESQLRTLNRQRQIGLYDVCSDVLRIVFTEQSRRNVDSNPNARQSVDEMNQAGISLQQRMIKTCAKESVNNDCSGNKRRRVELGYNLVTLYIFFIIESIPIFLTFSRKRFLDVEQENLYAVAFFCQQP